MSILTDCNSSKCSQEELKILGDYWTLQIIQVLEDGEKRFSEIERSLDEVSPTTLANRLRKLEDQQLISKQKETVDRLSVVYSLTDKGRGILPILREIKVFAVKYL